MNEILAALSDTMQAVGKEVETIDRGGYIDVTYELAGRRWLLRFDHHFDPISIQLVGTTETIYVA